MKKYITMFTRVFAHMDNKGMYFFSAALSGLTFIMLFATPVVNRMLVEMITGDTSHALRNILLMMFGLVLLAPFIAYGQYQNSLSIEKLSNNLRLAVFAHVQRLPLNTMAKRQTGDYIARISNDATTSSWAFSAMTILHLLRFLIVTTVAMVILITTEWRIAVLAVVYNVVCFLISIKLNPLVNKLEREALGQMAMGNNAVLETVRALPIVSIFAMGFALKDRYDAKLKGVYKARAKFRMVNGTVYGIVDFFSFSAQAVAFVMSIFLLNRGQVGLADAVYLASLMALTSGAMLSLSTFLLFLQRPLVASGRVFEILDEGIEDGLEDTAVVGDTSADVAVDISGISFTYPAIGGNERKTIFTDFSLSIAQGEHVALVGPSGGGKTTLVQLIAALYNPDAGQISYFGQSNLSTGQIRRLISYVPQEPVLFEGTVYQNIHQGRPDATEADVKQAATKAGLELLPLDTQVGERGTNISGGQRQRVAIARAILKDAPILILDEATSALDSETEDEIKETLASLSAGTEKLTRITIAHRPSTIQDADRVVEVLPI